MNLRPQPDHRPKTLGACGPSGFWPWVWPRMWPWVCFQKIPRVAFNLPLGQRLSSLGTALGHRFTWLPLQLVHRLSHSIELTCETKGKHFDFFRWEHKGEWSFSERTAIMEYLLTERSLSGTNSTPGIVSGMPISRFFSLLMINFLETN